MAGGSLSARSCPERLAVFDTATGRSIAQHGSAHASPIAAMAFSGDGTKLATADAEGTIKIWEDAREAELEEHGALDAQGPSRGDQHSRFFERWQAARHHQRRQDGQSLGPGKCRRGHPAIGTCSGDGSLVARFSPDGQLIAAADGRSVRLWDAATGRLVRELSAGDKGRVSSVAFSPTDNRLLAVGYGGRADVSYVALWDIDAGTELARLPGATDLPDFRVDEHNGAVGALAFSPDGKYLVAGFGSKTGL